ncbi:MAG: CoA pyrophosphatase [Actinomycetia bacterium]|nr:CoA pyrophosphatase [Actinomycetes bacterium]MCH9710071.1 CoA pyrophosphatase [Actinomycetes bacterium]MCH9766840.1 CoA pyrophosphatase [Actinomycetes bacterium]
MKSAGSGQGSGDSRVGDLTPAAAPPWLTPLVERPGAVKSAYRSRVPAEVLAALTAANTAAALTGARRDAAVLVLFSGPQGGSPGTLPDDADLLVTVRASTLRHHAGQAAFPGGATDLGDDGPVHTALREANEETGIDAGRLRPLATLERMFIPPSGFHVVPVLAYSPDPGPVAVVNSSETALVARVPVRAFVNPENRITVYRHSRRFAGPAFLLNQMLVWGFTGQVISAILDVAGWATPWDTDNVRELGDAMALLDTRGSYGDGQL